MDRKKAESTDRCQKRKNENHVKRAGRWVAICLFWLAFWQTGAMLIGNSLLLPSPAETLAALVTLFGERSFYLNVFWTMLRCALALLLSLAAGGICAWVAYRRDWIRQLLALPVSFFKAVPVMAIIIYVILLIRSDWVALPVCFLMCFPVVYTNLLGGLDAVSAELLEVAEIYELNGRQRLRLVYLPSLLMPLQTSLKLIAGLSWKAVVAAEVLAIPAYSLGYQMLQAKYYLETPRLFAYIAVIASLSIWFEKLICRLVEPLTWKAYEGSKLKKWLHAKNAAQKQGPENGREVGAASSDAGRMPTGKVRQPQSCSMRKDLGFGDSRKGNIGGGNFVAPAVAVRHVSKSFDGQRVLQDLSLRLEAGQITALMGPSGIGKTTLARMLAGLTLPDSGMIIIDGTYRLSFLFQEDRLLPWLNVYDNIALAFLNARRRFIRDSAEGVSRFGGSDASDLRRNAHSADSFTLQKHARLTTLPASRQLSGTEIDRRIRNLAEALELTEALYKLPAELSGGMRYRAAMGRAFAAPSELLILDEPFRGLDEALKRRIIDRMWEAETQGKTVLLITHRPEDSETLAQRTLTL